MGDKYNSNIFELLSEDASKKNKQQQKKDSAPAKVDNKGKGPAPANKGKSVSQSSKGQSQGASQGAQGGRARPEGRGRGGRGRGGRPEGRGRGGENSYPVDGERQGNNNNRGRQVSRRQREEGFKRGDYGAPDAERRQNRPMDKFAHSAGSKRKQEKKGGAGAGNWGTKGQEQEAPAAEEEEKNVDENVEAIEDEEIIEEEEEIVEESDEEIDYDAFVERQKEESKELSKLIQTDVRKVDAAEYEGLKTFSKAEETQFVAPSGKKKGKKSAKADNKVKVDLSNVRVSNDNKRRNQRPQRSQKRNVNLTLDDDKDFPSLGGK